MICTYTLVTGALAAIVILKFWLFGKRSRKVEILETNYKQNVVYLYQFPALKSIPNMSPFCLKVESFLRLHKINYECRYVLRQRSKYGLLPFIELNGEQVADSQIIEEHLKRHFKIQPHLSEYEESISRAASRLVSHHTSPISAKYKLVDETDAFIDVAFDMAGLSKYLDFLKPIAVWLFRRKAVNRVKRSMGLFSDSEFDMLLRKDLDTLKGLLGEKKFFLGDNIENVDASIFGHLASWYYMPKRSILADILDQDYPSLVSWVQRVREELFPNDFTRV